ncbi:MAG TPA: COX15/CtaA family protein [Tepidisphaeraceae bacterium]|jgi:cytochrome c oxidase assembly protein subunit 15
MSTLSYQSTTHERPAGGPFFICALAVAVSVFPLIFMGGLVTSHGAGMSVPDWPNSYGYNMFLFPPAEWVGGIFFEHTHRLLGTLSGFLSIILVCLAWAPGANPLTRHRLAVFAVAMLTLLVAAVAARWVLARAQYVPPGLAGTISQLAVGFASLGLVAAAAWCCRVRQPRRWLRWLSVVQLLAIIVQGVLGGTRVTHVSVMLAMIHGCFAQLFFCLAAFTALAASRWWDRAAGPTARGGIDPSSATAARRTAWLVAGVWCCVACQLVLGVLMRHNNAGLAIPDLPLAYGKLLPPTSPAGLDAINAGRAWQHELDPVSMAQVWMHYGHRVGAIVVSVAVLLLVFRIVRKHRCANAIAWPAYILLGLVATQFTLGLLTVYYAKPAEIASSHVAVGALTLMTVALLGAAAARVAQGAPVAVSTNEPLASNLEFAAT